MLTRGRLVCNPVRPAAFFDAPHFFSPRGVIGRRMSFFDDACPLSDNARRSGVTRLVLA
jgi:hypothetical protein